MVLAVILLLPLCLIGCGGGGTDGGDGGSGGSFTITGKITTDNGLNPIADATVTLYKSRYEIYEVDGLYGATVVSPEIVQTVATNGQGVYSFTGVHSGPYTIEPTSTTYVFKWSQVPTRDNIGVITITDSGIAYTYNPEGLHNTVSPDGTIIYNIGTPFTITGNVLTGQDFEASLPGGSGL
jgi:hypothetical protein